MSRTPCLLIAAIGLVWWLPQQAAEAGPVMLGLEAYAELAALTPAKEGAGRSRPDESPSQAKPQPPIQNSLISGGSMSGASSTTTGPSGAAGSALNSPSAAFQPAGLALYRVEPDHIFIPPRFLDGIFRPPEIVVSLRPTRNDDSTMRVG